jgi:hypothetical protein
VAKNIRQGDLGKGVTRVAVTPTDPATPASGDPVRWGFVPGVAEGAADAITGFVTVNLECIAELSVKGVDGSGNSAVAAGDKIYYVDADTPKLSKKATGTFFGYAFGNALTDGGADTKTGTLVSSAATTTIRVLIGRSHDP